MSFCYRCNTPSFIHGAPDWYKGPRCKCWSYYKPTPVTTAAPVVEGCKPLRQLTEDDVRRIVREELAKLSEGGS
jgi:hypothetical protein